MWSFISGCIPYLKLMFLYRIASSIILLVSLMKEKGQLRCRFQLRRKPGLVAGISLRPTVVKIFLRESYTVEHEPERVNDLVKNAFPR